MEEQIKAIREINRAWGVSGEDKLLAIEIVLAGKVKPQVVVDAVHEIRNALGGLKAME
jgi:hypothetical protein